ncbi:hypothetical protein EYF80_055097 [Liparis tanakae]|uniref:Uncharacterized protein n=1 Tax=Liparis tanakae TaxID=230148 RepID=A0A4Z2F1I3_9TELE|nr:hypothetical protein EYF80_055097 [Liparis tanakae]
MTSPSTGRGTATDLQAPEDLVDQELDVVVRQLLALHDVVEVGAHQVGHQVPVGQEVLVDHLTYSRSPWQQTQRVSRQQQSDAELRGPRTQRVHHTPASGPDFTSYTELQDRGTRPPLAPQALLRPPLAPQALLRPPLAPLAPLAPQALLSAAGVRWSELFSHDSSRGAESFRSSQSSCWVTFSAAAPNRTSCTRRAAVCSGRVRVQRRHATGVQGTLTEEEPGVRCDLTPEPSGSHVHDTTCTTQITRRNPKKREAARGVHDAPSATTTRVNK